jgi:carbamoyltransferase
MRIVGLYNWHDGGYAVLSNGQLVEHVEIERYTRLKESGGDSLAYFRDIYLKNNGLSMDDIDVWTSPFPDHNLAGGGSDTFDTHQFIDKAAINFYPHHLCHASHAFYSSNFRNALVVTLDSAGMDTCNRSVSTAAYYGTDRKIIKIADQENDAMSLGNLWGRFTRFVFKLSAGYPRGHQAGSVMAMAALGDPKKYFNEVFRAATTEFPYVKFTPAGYKRGVYVPPEDDVTHPYLQKFREIAESSEQEKFDIAAALQSVTENIVCQVVDQALKNAEERGISCRNVCFAGGVSLNSVAMGKILSVFGDRIDGIFMPPVPYDAGLSIGACQYHWHHILEQSRVYGSFVSPYLGEEYTKQAVLDAIAKRDGLVIKEAHTIEACVADLCDNKIVSIFQGRSESGRRALGNRSIVADPRSPEMKKMINDKVKHRQWYRPFAPSVLEEHCADWFEGSFPSPYMSFVFKFKADKLGKVPAVEHFDGTARIQTVNRDQNKVYYDLISHFYQLTGVPMLLNTSFNDREPICETPDDAICCFMGTDIDFLYFPEYKIRISKEENV